MERRGFLEAQRTHARRRQPDRPSPPPASELVRPAPAGGRGRPRGAGLGQRSAASRSRRRWPWPSVSRRGPAGTSGTGADTWAATRPRGGHRPLLRRPSVKPPWRSRRLGRARVLPHLDCTSIRTNPKGPTLQRRHRVPLRDPAKTGLVTFHAPTRSPLDRLLRRPLPPHRLRGRNPRRHNPPISETPWSSSRPLRTLTPGIARGLLGGNLTVLVPLSGCPYLPAFDGRSSSSKTYGRTSTHRPMMTQLRLAAVLVRRRSSSESPPSASPAELRFPDPRGDPERARQSSGSPLTKGDDRPHRPSSRCRSAPRSRSTPRQARSRSSSPRCAWRRLGVLRAGRRRSPRRARTRRSPHRLVGEDRA